MTEYDPFFDDPTPDTKIEVPGERFCEECHSDIVHDPECPHKPQPEFSTLEERAEGDPIVVLAKQPRKDWQIWCPACQFMFNRTKVAVARSWAHEHNNKVHAGQLQVLDLTNPTAEPAAPVTRTEQAPAFNW